MSRDPHYLRVARALALITGLAGVATGCGSDHRSPGTDSGMVADGSMRIDGSGGSDAGDDDAGGGTDGGDMDGGDMTDGGDANDGGGNDGGSDDGGTVIADGGLTCDECTCFGIIGEDAGLPICPSELIFDCGCAVIGPLYPPDLPV